MNSSIRKVRLTAVHITIHYISVNSELFQIQIYKQAIPYELIQKKNLKCVYLIETLIIFLHKPDNGEHNGTPFWQQFMNQSKN